jgi:hypothetical protein
LPQPLRACGACGELLELAELGELGELVELGMQNIKGNVSIYCTPSPLRYALT